METEELYETANIVIGTDYVINSIQEEEKLGS